MNDPMLSADPQEREKYSSQIMDVMRQAVEEDRQGRRAAPKSETPAVLIGGHGISSGLMQSL